MAIFHNFARYHPLIPMPPPRDSDLSGRRLKLVQDDPWLEPAEKELNDRYRRFIEKLRILNEEAGSLIRFAKGHTYFGFRFDRKRKGWTYREWAPHAEDLFLFGDFNGWQRYTHRLTRLPEGVWEIFLDYSTYKNRISHLGKVKVLVHSEAGWQERIPAYINRVVQDPATLDYTGQLWEPPKPFPWEEDRRVIGKLQELIIYECHPGMAQEKEGIGTFVEFADYIIPYIKKAGYNTIQLMAVAEHPYYGSFGYHVSSFFAVSSRFGTPYDLKYLVKKAHEQGLAVVMDLVHSHAAKNTREGLNEFDGSDDQYFLPGDRGNHPYWDSKVFNYGKREVLRFLLSNIKFWLEEFHLDGFRFDGVTSMLYWDHGFRDVWDLDGYFKSGVEWDAVTYLQLANTLVHQIDPDAVTIGEDVSGMPGLCRPVPEGGIGFDYRMAMAVPDTWIRILKEKKDEEWDIFEIWHVLNNRLPGVGTVAYCESHDQALVGDQTLAFRLMQAEIYTHMSKRAKSLVIDRGIALHKMIRFLTITLGGQAYLNFMGNEFGHPDWIDFPREGNNWSYKYARRQWSLLENPELRYQYLAAFDREMLALVKQYGLLNRDWGKQLNMDAENKTLVFERQGLIFVFNFHSDRSIPGYSFQVPKPGDYRHLLTTDHPRFGGLGRINEKQIHMTTYEPVTQTHWLSVYNTNRTAQVFTRLA
jgi:1,4-alpha-glucan branching enzyme